MASRPLPRRGEGKSRRALNLRACKRCNTAPPIVPYAMDRGCYMVAAETPTTGKRHVNLSFMLKERAADQPVRIGQIGAGKFGTMFLSQVRLTTGMHLMGLADLMPQRARDRMMEVGWPKQQTEAKSMADALKTGKTCITEDAMAVITHPDIEVVIEATGDPGTGIKLCQAAIAHGKHVVMVNVEADALAGPLLARRAKEAGVVYSLAWGDQPALICEHVD